MRDLGNGVREKFPKAAACLAVDPSESLNSRDECVLGHGSTG